MANEGLADDLGALLHMAEEIVDGMRSSFTPDEMERLCFDLRRAIDYLRNPDEDDPMGFTSIVPGSPVPEVP